MDPMSEPPDAAGAGALPFGRYHLLRPLGRGGMGEVFLGEARGAAGFRKRVVIKRILPELAREPRFVERFLAEGRLVVQLHHPHIVQVLDMGEEEGEIFLAMEYVDGWDLADVLRTLDARAERMPLHLALVVLVAIAEALAYAHAAAGEDGLPLGIVHRDVSPSNVVIGRQGAVKLLDFGIAAAGRDAGRDGGGGKVAWMAPEQARGEVASARSDLFSFGILAHELLTGLHPFRGYSDGQTLERVLGGERAHPEALRDADLPVGLTGLVEDLLRADPEARPRDAAEVVRRLREVALGLRSVAGFDALATWLEGRMARAAEPAGFDVEAVLGMGLGRAMVGGGRDRTLTRAPAPGSRLEAGVEAGSVEQVGAGGTGGAAAAVVLREGPAPRRRVALWVAAAMGVVALAVVTAAVVSADGTAAGVIAGSPARSDGVLTEPQTPPEGVAPAARDVAPVEGPLPAVAAPERDASASLQVGVDAEGAVGVAALTVVDASGAPSEVTDGAGGMTDRGPDVDDVGPVASSLARVRMKVEVVPDEARIVVVGVGASRSPFEADVEAGSRVVVRAEAEGYESRVQALVIDDDRTIRWKLSKVATGSVSFRVLPADASVTLDGEAVAVGPTGLVRGLSVASGPHTIVATLPDGRSVSRRFEVEAGGAVNLRTLVVETP
jgi:tRNA A-37 threonylcarbamoyl transferase component Bud32